MSLSVQDCNPLTPEKLRILQLVVQEAVDHWLETGWLERKDGKVIPGKNFKPTPELPRTPGSVW
ncbi:hypothetical protein N5923_19125 [Erwiniaceae bacterium BAC15a-03b]|uniref:Uncharacterized protein n=1 Tax=Winslowiella arboricola TaxID=2978220 RepID=A0A9J6PQ92_9GAMM|nr:hypothetical protein [Winslowiella arboricola]MCU5775548.1 hypothetical protein [Winslowiella arboricola]MCU5779602.1 hypothetical protein [Winslowiella arboricola]